MLTTIEAIVDDDGRIRCLEGVEMEPAQRVLVTIPPSPAKVHETALLSGPVLAEEWLRAEEDSAWQYLQEEPSSSSGSPSQT